MDNRRINSIDLETKLWIVLDIQCIPIQGEIMRDLKIINWILMVAILSITLFHIIWTADVVSLKIWMGFLAVNGIISMFAKEKFADLAYESLDVARHAINLSRVAEELLRREKLKNAN